MRKKFLSSCMMTLLGITALGLTSCSSDDNVIAEQDDAVAHYSPEGTSYISLSAEKETQTRSTLQENESYLNFQWNAGDKLLVVEPTVGAIGTLTTSEGSAMSTNGGSVSATFTGTVKGTLSDGDKLLFYYLGNKIVENNEKSVTCDFSTQDGTLTSAAALRYAATGEVEMKKDGDVFKPVAGLSLATKVSVLKFNISYSDGTSSFYASNVVTSGISNKATISLCDGTFTAGYMQDSGNADIKTISMTHTNEGATSSYYMAVPVFADATVFYNPSMTFTFFNSSVPTMTKSWNKWTIGMGKWYADQAYYTINLTPDNGAIGQSDFNDGGSITINP